MRNTSIVAVLIGLIVLFPACAPPGNALFTVVDKAGNVVLDPAVFLETGHINSEYIYRQSSVADPRPPGKIGLIENLLNFPVTFTFSYGKDFYIENLFNSPQFSPETLSLQTKDAYVYSDESKETDVNILATFVYDYKNKFFMLEKEFTKYFTDAYLKKNVVTLVLYFRGNEVLASLCFYRPME